MSLCLFPLDLRRKYSARSGHRFACEFSGLIFRASLEETEAELPQTFDRRQRIWRRCSFQLTIAGLQTPLRIWHKPSYGFVSGRPPMASERVCQQGLMDIVHDNSLPLMLDLLAADLVPGVGATDSL